MTKINQTLCAAFWNHTNIRSGDRIFPCCRFKHPIDTFNGHISNILESETYRDLREKSKNGIAIKGCEKCYLEEKLGKQSLRQEFNQQYNIDSVSLKYLEIGFDNICNLTCDGCWEEFSSAWSKIKNPDADRKSHIVSISEIKDSSAGIEKIVFLGGEPLMTNRHRRFLSSLPTREILEVIYYTNGTFLLDSASIEILNSCKTVKFILSIDGVEDLNDKVRSGSSWSSIIEFISQIKSLKFDLHIHSVIHKNNWFGFSELADFVDSIQVNWSVGLLTFPEYLCIDNLSSEEKSRLLDTLDTRLPNRDFIVNFLNHGTNRKPRKIYQLAKV